VQRVWCFVRVSASSLSGPGGRVGATQADAAELAAASSAGRHRAPGRRSQPDFTGFMEFTGRWPLALGTHWRLSLADGLRRVGALARAARRAGDAGGGGSLSWYRLPYCRQRRRSYWQPRGAA
jgi:hypothetical protein